jgi:DNA-binding SARP family transcriptional activator
MRFEFLGQVAVESGTRRIDAHGEQPALALARLVLERPAPLLRDELAELLWPYARPEKWEGPARQVISRARALLVEAGAASACIVSNQGRTELALDTEFTVDVEEAISAATDAEAAVLERDWVRAQRSAAVALDQLRRPFFPNSEAAWTVRWQARAENHLVRALRASARAALGLGRPDNVIQLAGEALELDSYDEAATRALMEAYDALGSRGNALAAYEQCRRILDEELGVRPSDETETLYLSLLGTAPTPPPRAKVKVRALEQTEMLPFVGRASEQAELRRAWESACNGTASAAVVAGEAGIGKTRLVAELARVVDAHEQLVIWGACVADVGLPYQPFGEILTYLLRARPGVRNRLGPLAADLAPLVPDLVEAAPSAEFDDHARARLFRAVTAAFEAVADEPVLVVIDDLQWAGDDALALLRHLLPTLDTRSGLIVMTVREATAGVAAALADVHRRVPSLTLSLGGLSVDDLAEVLTRSGVTLRGELHVVATELEARTTGNPFYVSQLVGDAAASHTPFDPGAVPEVVAQFVARRLDALDRELAATLSLAAVVGAEFDIEVVEACSPLDPDRLLEVIEEFCRQRFLDERAPGQFMFAHALVRDAVLATIGATRLQRLHRRIADALVTTDADPALLAYHYVAAGSTSADAATTWSLRAGRNALGQAAWSVAREQFATAWAHASDVDDRCAALVGQGRAERALGNSAAGREKIDEALALARSHGRGRAAAEATLALVGGGGRGVAVELADRARTALLRTALDGLDPTDVDLLVATLGELALSLVLTDAADEREALCERCVLEARRWGNPNSIALALQMRRSSLMGPDGTITRAADAREMLELPQPAIAPERVLAAQLALVEDLLELGDREGATKTLEDARQLADRLAHPFWSWSTTCWRTLDAIIDGRLDEAEALAFEAFAFQAPAEHPEATAALGVNLIAIRLFQDRPGEMLELLRTAADENPHIPAYRAVLALCAAEAGDHDTARAAIAHFRGGDYSLPLDSNWLLAVSVLADAAVTVGDAETCVALEGVLTPYADRQIVLNCFGGGGAYWGPVSYHLGRIAGLTGNTDAARAHLARAVEQADDFGAPLFSQRARAALAAVTSE